MANTLIQDENIKTIYAVSLNSNNIIDLINNKDFKVNDINKSLFKKECILLNYKNGVKMKRHIG